MKIYIKHKLRIIFLAFANQDKFGIYKWIIKLFCILWKQINVVASSYVKQSFVDTQPLHVRNWKHASFVGTLHNKIFHMVFNLYSLLQLGGFILLIFEVLGHLKKWWHWFLRSSLEGVIKKSTLFNLKKIKYIRPFE